ncbi:linear amide C-N hydrolase [Legionella nautarum]|nr:linear amide C-N hydrolase [Legionella nautarum]
MKKVLSSFLVILLLLSTNGWSCTRLFWNTKGAMVVGRSFDWDSHYNETILILPRGMQHVGGVKVNEAKWRSKFGSIVVQENHEQQTGITDGINEKGLAAHLLSFEDAQYEERDKTRQGVSVLQWLQYYLDNFASVKEVIKHIHDVQIETTHFAAFSTLPLHVAIEDSEGDSAIIEFIEGKLKIYHDRAYRVMTNEPSYAQQLDNLAYYEASGCQKPLLPLDDKSTSRFVRAACYMSALPLASTSQQAVAMISSIIENVSVPYGMSETEATWWRTFIDYSSHRYYFKSTRVPTFFWLDYAKIDFSRSSSFRQIEAHAPHLMGDLS